VTLPVWRREEAKILRDHFSSALIFFSNAKLIFHTTIREGITHAAPGWVFISKEGHNELAINENPRGEQVLLFIRGSFLFLTQNYVFTEICVPAVW
jgi:hypothetical protein